MSDPPICETNHANTKRMQEAQIVYGTPGFIFARYRCLNCGIEWDDPSEPVSGISVRYWQKEGGVTE